MNENPLVSVIIPTYNSSRTLEKTLVSIVNQTYKNIIITDQIENIQKWEYPLVSIRELVMNCIIHRDYRWPHTQIRIFPDYIEFFNAGWLPSDISIDEFLKWERMSYIRNKQIVELFKDMWEIEKFWSGIRRNKAIIEKEWWKVEIKTDKYSFMIRVYSNKNI